MAIDKQTAASQTEDMLIPIIEAGYHKEIKFLIGHAASNGFIDEIDDRLIKAALLSFCMEVPNKVGRPKGRDERSSMFKYACSLACKVKVGTLNASLDKTKYRKNASFTSVWEEYNSCMARPVKQKQELWRCAGILNIGISGSQNPYKKTAELAMNRFRLSPHDLQVHIDNGIENK